MIRQCSRFAILNLSSEQFSSFCTTAQIYTVQICVSYKSKPLESVKSAYHDTVNIINKISNRLRY